MPKTRTSHTRRRSFAAGYSRKNPGQGWCLMDMSIEKRITRELTRLRMWRDVANAEEVEIETVIAHDRMNGLLDEWEKQHSHDTQRRGHPTSV